MPKKTKRWRVLLILTDVPDSDERLASKQAIIRTFHTYMPIAGTSRSALVEVRMVEEEE